MPLTTQWLSSAYATMRGWFSSQPMALLQPPRPPDAAPKQGAVTGPQQSLFRIAVSGAGCWDWNGAEFVHPPFGADDTYRLMDRHPTLAYLMAKVTGTIEANEWIVEKNDDSVPDAWVEEVKTQLLPQRMSIMAHALSALKMKRAPFEKVWRIEENRKRVWMKPLLPELSGVYHDQQGVYAGLQNFATVLNARQAPATDPANLLTPQYSWLYVNQPKAEGLDGTSWYDAAYDPWCDWQRTRLDAAKLRGKLSGIIPILYYPPGETPMGGGMMDNGKIGDLILQNIGVKGKGVGLPSAGFEEKDIAENPKLAGLSLWRLDFYDGGNHSPAIGGFINEREYNDKLMARACRTAERAAFEATQAGSRADSESHTASGTTILELIDKQIAEALHDRPGQPFSGVVDDILLYNFGEKAKGQVIVKAAPLADPQVDFLQQYLLKAKAQGDQEIDANQDSRAILERANVPVLSEQEAAQKQADAQALQQQQLDAAAKQPPQPLGKQGNNGNGRLKQLQNN